MRVLRSVVWLSGFVAVGALIAAAVGLLRQDGGGPFPFTTLRGQEVLIYGRGLYRYDTLFAAAGARGADTVVLFLGIPLLVATTLLTRRGSLRGGLLHLGVLFYFLYAYMSYALGTVTYNELFLLYTALFSASLWAFVLMFGAFDREALASRFSERMPVRGPGIFMLASGLVTLVVWGGPMVAALVRDQIPERLDTYSTMLTFSLDLATITPATFLAGVLILRRQALGYLIALAMLPLEAFLAPLIIAQTVSQVSAGVTFPPGQIIGPIAGFLTLGVVAFWFTYAILRGISE